MHQMLQMLRFQQSSIFEINHERIIIERNYKDENSRKRPPCYKVLIPLKAEKEQGGFRGFVNSK